MKIKPEWIFYGMAAGVLLLWLKSRADNNKDGKADGLFSSLGYSVGRAPVDAVVGFFDGALDAAVDPIGGSYQDCQDYKRSGNKWGVLWACGPSDWADAW